MAAVHLCVDGDGCDSRVGCGGGDLYVGDPVAEVPGMDGFLRGWRSRKVVCK